MKKLVFAVILAGVLGGMPEDRSFTVDPNKIAWQPIKMEGMPDGLMSRVLHENPRTKMGNFLVRYPKGFREPRHYHETCGHYIYVLKGRLRSAEGDMTAGMFAYAAPKERHGPYNAVEETDILFYTDGPFDFLVDK